MLLLLLLLLLNAKYLRRFTNATRSKFGGASPAKWRTHTLR